MHAKSASNNPERFFAIRHDRPTAQFQAAVSRDHSKATPVCRSFGASRATYRCSSVDSVRVVVPANLVTASRVPASSAAGTQRDPGSPDGAITLNEVLRELRAIWRPVLAGGAIGLLAGGLVGIARPRSYSARADFVAEQSRVANVPSGIGALAAQFGLDIAADAGRSPQFYRQLLTTSSLLTSLLDSVIAVAPGERQTVRALLRGDSSSDRRNLDRMLRRFRSSLATDVDPRTSIVSFSVRARTPVAAEGIARLLISAVKHFNVTTRQLQARERRIFLEGRVAAAQAGLEGAEDSLRSFYTRNRRFSESPNLVFEEARLKRAIDLRQDLYTTLSKELETARIQEVNDTPTITVVDDPLASAKPTGPGALVLALLFFLLGAGAVTAWQLVTEH